jgi:ubiquinone/menaquinone biosynthesis C-methylase UbiE
MEPSTHYTRFVARIYDPLLYPALHRIRKAVTAQVVKAGSHSVIDMCCGTGIQLLQLKKVGVKKIAGIDISDNMLAQARRKGLDHVCFKMDAAHTSFAKNTYDAAIVSFALHENTRETAFSIMKEARRIVRPSGILIIVDYSNPRLSNAFGTLATHVAERLVGGQHYRNYRHYMKTKLLKRLTYDLPLISSKSFIFGAVTMQVFKNQPE